MAGGGDVYSTQTLLSMDISLAHTCNAVIKLKMTTNQSPKTKKKLKKWIGNNMDNT